MDQLVDRVLFASWAEADKDTAMRRAGKVGWSPLPVGFYDLLEHFPSDVLATDCSAFDWTFPGWVVHLLCQVKLEQTCGTTQEYERAVRTRLEEVLGPRCVLRLPSGERLLQTRWGVMKSGWFLTINLNSDAQDMITSLAYYRAYGTQAPLLWSMGDDVIMRWKPGLDSTPLVNELRRAGILSKFAETRREFAGFSVQGGNPVVVNPLYPNKHKFLLAHVPSEQLEEVVTSLGLIYALASDKEKDWLKPLLRKYARWPQSSFEAWAYGLLGPQTMLSTGQAAALFSLE